MLERFSRVLLFTDDEYDFLSVVLNTMYNDLLDFPDLLKTPNFNILETLVNTRFSE